MVLSGCIETPSLEVSVDWGADDALFAKDEKRVDLYEIEGLTCDDIKFGKTLLADIAKFRITSQEDVKNNSLGSFTTDGPKLILAKGFQGERIVRIGCIEVGKVSGAQKVAISTVRTVQVNAEAIASTNVPAGLNVQLSVTDFDNNLVADAAIQWTLYGPAGAVFADANAGQGSSPSIQFRNDAQDKSDANGSFPKDFKAPSITGPYAVKPRVAWALEPSTPVTGFATHTVKTMPDVTVTLPELVRTCVVGSVAAGETGLHCVESDENARPPIPPTLVSFLYNAADDAIRVRKLNIFGAASVVGPITVAGGSSSIHVVTVGGDVWSIAVAKIAGQEKAKVSRIGQIGLSSPIPIGNNMEILQFPTQAMFVAKCGPASSDALAVSLATGIKDSGKFEFMSGAYRLFRLGDPASAESPLNFAIQTSEVLPPLALQSAGCVTNVANNTTYQGIVAGTFSRRSGDKTVSRMVFAAEANNEFGGAFDYSQFSASGFVNRGESRVLSASADLTGITIQESVLSKPVDAKATARLLSRRTVRTSAVPILMVSGSLDKDNSPDLAWLIRGDDSSTVQVMVDQPINDGFVTGTFELARETFIGLADMDGNGTDDIVSFGAVDDAGNKKRQVSIMRMGVAPK
jgi:hypothetical protein